jgi:hypothetical protein
MKSVLIKMAQKILSLKMGCKYAEVVTIDKVFLKKMQQVQ